MKPIVEAMFKNGNDLLQNKISKKLFWERQVEHERLVEEKQKCFSFTQKGGTENGKGPCKRQGHDFES